MAVFVLEMLLYGHQGLWKWLKRSRPQNPVNARISGQNLAHQNRTIDFRVDGAKSPEIPQTEGFRAQKSRLEIANR